MACSSGIPQKPVPYRIQQASGKHCDPGQAHPVTTHGDDRNAFSPELAYKYPVYKCMESFPRTL
eukprot:3947308-Amphidinium_carterae.1